MGALHEIAAGLWHFAQTIVVNIYNDARNYGVNPRIFVALYLVTWPMWYYTMWRVASGWHRKDRARMKQGIWCNRLVTVVPYAYVLISGGSGMSLGWYVFTIALPTITTSLFLHKVKNDEWMEKWWEFYKKALSHIHLRKSNNQEVRP